MGKYYVICAELGIFGEKAGIFAGRLNSQNRPDDDYNKVTEDAVKAAAEYLLHEHRDFYFSHDDASYIMRVVRDEPACDESVRRKGHWMFHAQKSDYLWKCSNCKGNFDQRFSYCPHCGAAMDGGNET